MSICQPESTFPLWMTLQGTMLYFILQPWKVEFSRQSHVPLSYFASKCIDLMSSLSTSKNRRPSSTTSPHLKISWARYSLKRIKRRNPLKRNRETHLASLVAAVRKAQVWRRNEIPKIVNLPLIKHYLIVATSILSIAWLTWKCPILSLLGLQSWQITRSSAMSKPSHSATRRLHSLNKVRSISSVQKNKFMNRGESVMVKCQVLTLYANWATLVKTYPSSKTHS